MKKIKVYKGPDGLKKGDALVTYHRADAAAAACIQVLVAVASLALALALALCLPTCVWVPSFVSTSRRLLRPLDGNAPRPVPLDACGQYHHLNIGDGYVISVTRAAFSHPKDTDTAPTDVAVAAGIDPRLSGTASIRSSSNSSNSSNSSSSSTSTSGGGGGGWASLEALQQALPPECLAHSHPVVVLSNVYDPALAAGDGAGAAAPGAAFFADLEADLLIACVRHGKVVRLVTLDGPGFAARGSVAVTFAAADGAVACAAALHGRRFDGRVVDALVVGATATATAIGAGAGAGGVDSGNRPPPAAGEADAPLAAPAAADDDGLDVDEFLTSLL